MYTTLFPQFLVFYDVKLVQAATGHTTAAMTMKHYVNPREDVIKAGWVIEGVYGVGIAKKLQGGRVFSKEVVLGL